MLKPKLKYVDLFDINKLPNQSYFWLKMTYTQIAGLSKKIVADSLIPKPTAVGGISWGYLLPATVGIAGVTAAGLGLKHLFSSNNPERMSTEKPINHEIEQNRPNNINKSLFQQAKDWSSDTGYLIRCVLQDWFSEQSPECAAFRQRAKSDGGIYAKFANLSSWTKGMLIGGASLLLLIPLIKIAFDRYARTGNMSVVQPEIKPEIKPTINPEIKPEFKNEIKPEIKPEFNLNYEPGYDPDYNPNLLQNYVPTINVNTAKPQPPQIVIQPKGTVFVPYEEGKKYTRKNHGYYDWLFE